MEQNKSNSIKEEWRDIEGYEGYYQVSNLGRVKSVARIIPHIRNGKERNIRVKERIRKLDSPEKNNYYCSLLLSKNGVIKNHLVHRLVAQAFIKNENPELYNEVDHINHDVTDNRVSNLRWTDRFGNMRNQRRCIAKRERELKTSILSFQDKIKEAIELFEL